MKKIKFRGLGHNEKYYFGELVVVNGSTPYINTRPGFTSSLGEYVAVLENSVAQFVGYDKNGKEIYSDDTVVNAYGAEIPFSAVQISYEDIGKKFTNLRLKGVTKQYAI